MPRADHAAFALGERDSARGDRVSSRDGKQPDFPLDARIARAAPARLPAAATCAHVPARSSSRPRCMGDGLRRASARVARSMAGTLGIGASSSRTGSAAALRGACRRMRAGACGPRPGAAAAAQSRSPRPTRCSASRASATDAEVKKAYRRLMNQNHPDKLVASGLPESMVEVAQAERTQRDPARPTSCIRERARHCAET